MPLQLVDVLCDSFAASLSLVAEWARAEPRVHFVPARDGKSLLFAVEARRPLAVVVCVTGDNQREIIGELQRIRPTLPLVVLTDRVAAWRATSLLCVVDRDDREGALRGVCRALRPSTSSMQRVSIATLAQQLALEGRSCVVSVRSGELSGRLFFRLGTVVHAECEGAPPSAAAHTLMTLRECETSIDALPATSPRTIDLPVDFLVDDGSSSERPRLIAPRAEAPPYAKALSGEYRLALLDPRSVTDLVDAVFLNNGTTAAAIVDVERVLILAHRSRDGERALSAAVIAALASAAAASVRQGCDAVNEIVIRRASSFEVLHFLSQVRPVVLWASFDPKLVTISIACSRLAHFAGTIAASQAAR
ncbi:MAG: DUF4388 domain-containing protein [Myxococcales bacterium]|nr:DUF4388 domain-containing protein [Myxococcales bacterium]